MHFLYALVRKSSFSKAQGFIIPATGVGALQTMVDICNDYANKYDIKFNAKKSQLIILSVTQRYYVIQ